MSMSDADDTDLLADLDAALDGTAHETPAQAQEKPEQAEAAETQEERLYRREGRRFVAKEEEKSAQEAAEVAQAAAPKPAWKPTWYKNEYGDWDKLPEPFRNALRDQERNAAQAIEKHSTSAKAWEPLTKALEPYKQHFTDQYTPQQYFSELHEWNARFRTTQDPVARIDMLDALAQTVGLDLVQVGEWLAQNGKAPQPDPQIAALQRKIAELEGQFTQSRTSGEEAAKAQTQKEIADWSKDKPHFAAVRPYMVALAKQFSEASLDQLYDEACYAHPEIRQSILKEQEDKRLAELKGKRAAGAQSPRGGQTNGAARPPKMSLEDEIAMHLDGA